MDKVKEIIQKKPLEFLVVSLVYLLAVGFFKWRLKPPDDAIFFLVGGALGIYFLDGAEAFFQLSPSPFRSVVFAAGFALVSFFVVTSSGSFVATGLVLSLYLTLILWQVGELGAVGNLNSWYRMVAGVPTINQQKWMAVVLAAIFLVETYLFIR